MAFTKLHGAKPGTIDAIVRGFDEQDWREVDAFLDETSDLSYVEQFERLGPIRTDRGDEEHEQSAENVIKALHAHEIP